jgi:hypothetical protein
MTVDRFKDSYVQIRIRDDIKADLQKVAELRGLTMSALLHSLIVRTIREEKELSPQGFGVIDLTKSQSDEIQFERFDLVESESEPVAVQKGGIIGKREPQKRRKAK